MGKFSSDRTVKDYAKEIWKADSSSSTIPLVEMARIEIDYIS